MSIPAQLTLETQKVGNIAVIRCQGRIVTGSEVLCLQQEVEKLTLGTKNVVLHLGEVSYIDSGGLGALVRLSGVLRASHGNLHLCQLSPFVHQVLQATSLHRIFPTYESERAAIESFSARSRSREGTSWQPRTRVVCVDTSIDLLAYVHALLNRAGYEVFTSAVLSDAVTLVKATKPGVLICGPGMRANQQGIKRLSQIDPKIPLLELPADFSTAEASHTGLELVRRVRSVLTSSSS